MKYSNSKEINSIVRQLIQQGWVFKWGKKHGRLNHPNGRSIVIVPKSPSDWRAKLNLQQYIRNIV